MPICLHLSYNLFIPLNALPLKKKGRTDASLPQAIQHLRRVDRMRAVIEGQRHYGFILISRPVLQSTGPDCTVPPCQSISLQKSDNCHTDKQQTKFSFFNGEPASTQLSIRYAGAQGCMHQPTSIM